jgi:hypothetical protein
MSDRDELKSYIAHLQLTVKALVTRLGGEVILTDQELMESIDYVLNGEEDPISKQVTLRVRLPLLDGGPAPQMPPLPGEE